MFHVAETPVATRGFDSIHVQWRLFGVFLGVQLEKPHQHPPRSELGNDNDGEAEELGT